MSHIETATHRATQADDTPFRARITTVWGVWVRLLNRDHLKGVFTREADARAFARQAAGTQNLAEVRRIRVLVNLDAREAYRLGDPSDPLIAVDVDFQQKMRKDELRAQALSRLSPEERAALGLLREEE
ncbi:MAG: hypothetical protein KDG52_06615 [Rhodocyclaceae bacterium]|nr:hypothetical protein [Rhodocyclaceae bacterium]